MSVQIINVEVGYYLVNHKRVRAFIDQERLWVLGKNDLTQDEENALHIHLKAMRRVNIQSTVI